MLLSEPAPSQGDLHFEIGDIPVRIHPFFWVTGLITGLAGAQGEPRQVLLWIAVVFVSILIHELGHALLQRYYGERPRIVLYSFGGLAIGSGSRGPLEQILISLAGPGAGFLLAGLLLGLMALSGVQIGFVPAWSEAEITSPSLNLLLGRLWFDGISNWWGARAIHMLLYVNLLWGLVNLLPIYPLDGGRVSREVFTMASPPRQGIVQSLWLSIICAVGLGLAIAIKLGPSAAALWTLALFGYLAYSNYQTLEAYTGRGPSRGW